MLTSDRSDHTVAIFYQLFEEFAGPLQLHLIRLESLPEVRTVQIAVAELQRRMPHLLGPLGFQTIEAVSEFWGSHAAYAPLPLSSHRGSHLSTGAETMVSVGACGGCCSAVRCREQRGASGRFHFPLWLV